MPSVTDTASALADPTRREILHLIRGQERSVGAIASHFSITRPAISQHLRVLQTATLVTVRREGRSRYYRARPAGADTLRAWLHEFWSEALDALKTEAEFEHSRRTNEGAAH